MSQRSTRVRTFFAETVRALVGLDAARTAEAAVLLALSLTMAVCDRAVAQDDGKTPPTDGRYMQPHGSDRQFVVKRDGVQPGTPPDTGVVGDPTKECRHPSDGRGEYTFTIPVTRYVNAGPDQTGEDNEASPVYATGPAWKIGTLVHAQEMVAAGTLGATADVTVAVYMHVNDNGGHYEPARGKLPMLKVYFNGRWLNDIWTNNTQGLPTQSGDRGGYLWQSPEQWQRDTWQLVKLRVPIEAVRFPAHRGVNGQLPAPAINNVRIAWDTSLGTTIYYCLAVDWASLEIKAMSPVILMHGTNQTAAWWSLLGYRQELQRQYIPVQTVDARTEGDPFGHGTDGHSLGINETGMFLPRAFTRMYSRWGSSQIHVIAHSMGGLHFRTILSKRYDQLTRASTAANAGEPQPHPVVSLTTLSTPHNGSVLADLSHAQYVGLHGVDVVWNPALPAGVDILTTLKALFEYTDSYTDLTTARVGTLNAEQLTPTASLPIPGADTVFYESHGGDADSNGDGIIEWAPSWNDQRPNETVPMEQDSGPLKRATAIDSSGAMQQVELGAHVDWTKPYRPSLATTILTTVYRTLGTERRVDLTALPPRHVVREYHDRSTGDTFTVEYDVPVLSADRLSAGANDPIEPNDMLVTRSSAMGAPLWEAFAAPSTFVFHQGALAGTSPGKSKNHSSIGDADVAALCGPRVLYFDRERGGMRPSVP